MQVVLLDGKPQIQTLEHTTSNLLERQRIKQEVGIIECVWGVERVAGCLTVSRALGDTEFRSAGVSGECPDPM